MEKITKEELAGMSKLAGEEQERIAGGYTALQQCEMDYQACLNFNKPKDLCEKMRQVCRTKF